jgi:hypothetical protein
MIDQPCCGVSAARILVGRASPGKFLASLDPDDVWLARKLTLTFAALEQNLSAAPDFSDYIRILDSALLGEARTLVALAQWMIYYRACGQYCPAPE